MKKIIAFTFAAALMVSASAFAEAGGRVDVSKNVRGTAVKELMSNKGGAVRGADRAGYGKDNHPTSVGKPAAE